TVRLTNDSHDGGHSAIVNQSHVPVGYGGVLTLDESHREHLDRRVRRERMQNHDSSVSYSQKGGKNEHGTEESSYEFEFRRSQLSHPQFWKGPASSLCSS